MIMVVATIVAISLAVGLFAIVPNLLNQRLVSPRLLSGSFIIDPYPPDIGQTVSFVASATGGTPRYSFSWTFGDSRNGTGQTVTHAYSTNGTFNVILTVKDSSSPQQSATSRQAVTVITLPPPPSSSPEIRITYSSSYNSTLQPSGIQPGNSGNTYLVVHLKIQNLGYQNFSANAYGNMYVTIGTSSYNVSAAYIFLQYPFPPTNMTDDQTATGDVVFEVPLVSTSFVPSWRLVAGENITFDWKPI